MTDEGSEWTVEAASSHNGYLDVTLTLGLPGLLLVLLICVVSPLKNFQIANLHGDDSFLADLFLQIWLLGIYLSSTESFFLNRVDPSWLTFLIAVFGLHYLARFPFRA
jgi:O-antigen ligase